MSQYSLDDLLYLMARLRAPEDGCPWDIKQTYQTILPHTLEEAYEVADAIDSQDFEQLKGELGDLLFQVVFYAQLGKEDQLFDLTDIIDQLVQKLIRRHPHVFPEGSLTAHMDTTNTDESEVKANWEAIKRSERKSQKKVAVLSDIPTALPALNRAIKLQKRAAQMGFDWDNIPDVLDKIEEEIAEVREALAEGHKQKVIDEMGDLMFAQVNLARHLDVDPEVALRSCNNKFTRRFEFIEQHVNQSGLDWDNYSLDELDKLWDQAKKEGL